MFANHSTYLHLRDQSVQGQRRDDRVSAALVSRPYGVEDAHHTSSYPHLVFDRWSLGSLFAPVALQVMSKTDPLNWKVPIYTQWGQLGLMAYVFASGDFDVVIDH